jgi:hypothetical protein
VIHVPDGGGSSCPCVLSAAAELVRVVAIWSRARARRRGEGRSRDDSTYMSARPCATRSSGAPGHRGTPAIVARGGWVATDYTGPPDAANACESSDGGEEADRGPTQQ